MYIFTLKIYIITYYSLSNREIIFYIYMYFKHKNIKKYMYMYINIVCVCIIMYSKGTLNNSSFLIYRVKIILLIIFIKMIFIHTMYVYDNR